MIGLSCEPIVFRITLPRISFGDQRSFGSVRDQRFAASSGYGGGHGGYGGGGCIGLCELLALGALAAVGAAAVAALVIQIQVK